AMLEKNPAQFQEVVISGAGTPWKLEKIDDAHIRAFLPVGADALLPQLDQLAGHLKSVQARVVTVDQGGLIPAQSVDLVAEGGMAVLKVSKDVTLDQLVVLLSQSDEIKRSQAGKTRWELGPVAGGAGSPWTKKVI
ncbi:MAG: hypothetical protein PHI23_02205, partial [Candidatus Peribacteraceae bacterium]|nr:hypothetical protein [Candidatus Peribacteraceae bacterium]